MGVRDEKENSLTRDMKWAYCSSCGCVQLSELIDPKVLYKNPHNPAIGKTWENHNKNFVDFIIKNKPKNVLDIGGANLKIANLLCEKIQVDKYDIIDFSSNKYEVEKINKRINLIRGSVEQYGIDNKVDCVILSHTLEHIYEPISFLKNIKKFLSKDGKIYISVPNIKKQLEDNFLNALHFEHTYFIDHEYIKILAYYAGLALVEQQEFSEYNSFYVLTKDKIDDGGIPIHSNRTDAKRIFKKFIKNVKKDVTNINYLLANRKAYIFGAHVFTQYLINFGLEEQNIEKIIDNDHNKINKFLYGTNIEVESPSILKEKKSPILILRVAQYKKEIIEDIKNINKETIII